MYNKFAKGDLIKITNPAITYPVSANIEMWDNNELRTFENLNRPIRNLFENNQELYSIIKNLQNGLKMGGSSILNGCELVVSKSLDGKRYVSLTPGLFFYDNVSYSIYPTPSIASRQLEKDLDIYTEDGINYINITYENGKFSADINISAHHTDTTKTISNIDRGIDLLAEIKETLTTADFTGFKNLHEYILEPCFEITSGKKFVNFNETTGVINLEDSTATLSFGFVDNFDPTNNESANWEGLIGSAYKDNSVTNAKLDDMAEDTLKGNDDVSGDPKDLGKAEVVTMFDLVTRDTPQTIDETKTFTKDQEISNTKKLIFSPNWSISSNDSNAFVIDESGTSRISIAGNKGAMTIVNPVSLSGTLDVAGATTLANSLTVNATKPEESISLSGPTTITGITKVIGDFTVGDTDDGNITKVNNPVELSDTLDVSGISTLNNSLTVNASSGNVSIKAPTTITGITTVIGDFTIGDTPDDGSMTVNNPVILNDKLTVKKETIINSSLTVNPTGVEEVFLNGPTETRDFKIVGNLTVDSSDYLKSIKLNGPTNINGGFVVVSNGDNEEISMTGNTTIISKTGENDFINLSTPNLSTTSKTILLNSTDSTEEDAENRGIVVRGISDKSFLWNSNNWVSSENLNLKINKTYKINDTDVLTSDTLGAEIVNSSLKTVGTIIDGTWNGTTIAVDNGGTGATSYKEGQLLIGKTDGGLGVATITGTTGGVSVTNGDGSITLNTPQPIAKTSSPTFKGLTLSSDLAINGNAITTTETTGFSILDTSLTGTLSIAKLAGTITMGEVADINIGKALNDKTVSILGNKSSTNSTTGALVVSGGVGISGDVNIGGTLTTTGKITGSAGIDITATSVSLNVSNDLISLTGNSKSIISSTENFSVKKYGTDGNLLSVKHSGITVDVGIVSSKAITSADIIKASKFVATGTGANAVSDINSKEFNSNTIKNAIDPTSGDNISLLWVNGTGSEIKRTLFTDFPVAQLEGTTAKNGLMPATFITRIERIEELAGIETSGDNFSLVRTVNGEIADATSGNVVVYGSLININKETYVGSDGEDEKTTSISGAIRKLITEKVRVKGHLPLNTVASKPVGQIIKKTKGGTAVTWGQITDDEIENTLTKVSPSSKKGNIANTTETIHKVAFWNNDEKSLLSHDDITYNTSSKTLIAETVSSRSSRKLKKDIELYEKSAFDTIDKIDIVSYHFIADETQTDRVGFIAEDSPELVSGKDRDHMEMNNCIGLLLKAVQELKEENQELRKLINDRNS